MPHFWINQRYFPQPKVCGLLRNGVRHAPFKCAPYSVLLCGLLRFLQKWGVVFFLRVMTRKKTLHTPIY